MIEIGAGLVFTYRSPLIVAMVRGGSAARTALGILGGVAGYAVSIMGTFAVQGDEFGVGAGHVALWTASATAGAVGGYYLGRKLTRRTTILVVDRR
ncbi:MAG: hypothetical protein FJW37_15330 [Acidobacteria bacterium]|nr:hypothetical protein [Acidobacteriota bacterium]